MKRMLLLVAVALLLFGISAGLSYFLNSGDPGTVAGNKPAGEAPAKRAPGWSSLPKADEKVQVPGAVPPPILPVGYNAQAEATVQYAAKFKAQEERIQQQQKALEEREKMLKFVADELTRERDAVDKLKKEVNQLLAMAEAAAQALAKDHDALDMKKKKTAEDDKKREAGMVKVDQEEMDKIKKLAGVYEKMEPEKAAEILQKMADKGELKRAAEILAAMSETRAARVLDKLSDNDPDVAVQMLSKVLSLKPPPKNSKK